LSLIAKANFKHPLLNISPMLKQHHILEGSVDRPYLSKNAALSTLMHNRQNQNIFSKDIDELDLGDPVHPEPFVRQLDHEIKLYTDSDLIRASSEDSLAYTAKLGQTINKPKFTQVPWIKKVHKENIVKLDPLAGEHINPSVTNIDILGRKTSRLLRPWELELGDRFNIENRESYVLAQLEKYPIKTQEYILTRPELLSRLLRFRDNEGNEFRSLERDHTSLGELRQTVGLNKTINELNALFKKKPSISDTPAEIEEKPIVTDKLDQKPAHVFKDTIVKPKSSEFTDRILENIQGTRFRLQIKQTRNNLFATFYMIAGKTITNTSTGCVGFHGPRRTSPFASEQVGRSMGIKLNLLTTEPTLIEIKSPVNKHIKGFISQFVKMYKHTAGIILRIPASHNGLRRSKKRNL